LLGALLLQAFYTIRSERQADGAAGRLVRRDVVHVQDLLNYIVNLPEHETAHLFLPLGRREQNDSRDHGANVRENVAKFVWRAQPGFYVFPHGRGDYPLCEIAEVAGNCAALHYSSLMHAPHRRIRAPRSRAVERLNEALKKATGIVFAKGPFT